MHRHSCGDSSVKGPTKGKSSPGDTQETVQETPRSVPRIFPGTHVREWYIVVNFSTLEDSKNDVGERDSASA